MIITILGTRGGIGSTTLLWNIYKSYSDCKTCWLSLTPPLPPVFFSDKIKSESIYTLKKNIPKWNFETCNFCNDCINNCSYNAILKKDDVYIVKTDVCNSCNMCVICCKQNAYNMLEFNVGNINCFINNGNDVLNLVLNNNELLSQWHVSEIYKFLKSYIKSNDICFVDVSSGRKELWSEIIKMSDVVLFYTDDVNFWNLFYKSNMPRSAKLILVVSSFKFDDFVKNGFSYAISVEYDREIAVNSIHGEVVSDINYKKSINEIKRIINENN